MENSKRGTGTLMASGAETAAAVESIGRMHHMLGGIDGSLTVAKKAARALLTHSHALPGGVPREAAVAIAKLRLEVAHNDALTLETLRSVVETIPVPEVQLRTVCSRGGEQTPEVGAQAGWGLPSEPWSPAAVEEPESEAVKIPIAPHVRRV